MSQKYLARFFCFLSNLKNQSVFYSRRRPLSLLMGYLLGGFMLLTVPASARTSERIWRVDYASGPMTGGKTSIFLAPNAIKISTIAGYSVFAKAPGWNATVCDFRQKLDCVVPAAVWRTKRGFFVESSETDDEFDPKNVLREDTVKFWGLKSRRRTWRAVYYDHGFYRINNPPKKCTIQLCETAEIPSVREQIELISAWVPLPRLEHVPLLVGWIFDKGGKISRFEAQSVRICNVPETEFRPPSGFKRVKSARDLSTARYSSLTQGMLEDAEALEKTRRKK